MSLLAAAALAAAVPLAWEGTAVVHDGATSIPITVRSRVEASGRIVSESWPTAIGEAKALRRFILEPSGQGTIERGGKSEPAPAAFAHEEVAQFGFYQQLQAAARWCAGQAKGGEAVKEFEGPVTTSFRCSRGRLTNAANFVAAEGAPVRQDFRLDGMLKDGDGVFPRRMFIKRGGQPFFDLTVTRFRSR